jgi:hypothetical protein
VAVLDHDDTSSYGPETITLINPSSGTYPAWSGRCAEIAKGRGHPSGLEIRPLGPEPAAPGQHHSRPDREGDRLQGPHRARGVA